VGDGWPCVDRNHSAFLYRFGPATLLIDCGEAVTRNYAAAGLDSNLIDRIFLSHLHCDHVGGFFMFIQGLWLQQREKELPVHLPAYAVPPVRNLLDAAMQRCGIVEQGDQRLGAVQQYRGRLIEDSTAAEFFAQPRTDEGRKFIAGELLV